MNRLNFYSIWLDYSWCNRICSTKRLGLFHIQFFFSVYIPFLFLQRIITFSALINKGKVYCKLSIISIMSPHILISDHKAGINTKINVTTLKISWSFGNKATLASLLIGGHNPTIFNIRRFRPIAHSKSEWSIDQTLETSTWCYTLYYNAKYNFTYCATFYMSKYCEYIWKLTEARNCIQMLNIFWRKSYYKIYD